VHKVVRVERRRGVELRQASGLRCESRIFGGALAERGIALHEAVALVLGAERRRGGGGSLMPLSLLLIDR